AGAELRRVEELPGDPLVLGNEAAREIERAAGDMGVHVHAAGKHQHPGRVDRAAGAAVPICGDATIVADVDVLDDAIYAVGRIVDSSARYSDHGITRAGT